MDKIDEMGSWWKLTGVSQLLKRLNCSNLSKILSVRMYVCMYVCMNEWMNEWTNEWMYECINVLMYVCMYVLIYIYTCAEDVELIKTSWIPAGCVSKNQSSPAGWFSREVSMICEKIDHKIWHKWMKLDPISPRWNYDNLGL